MIAHRSWVIGNDSEGADVTSVADCLNTCEEEPLPLFAGEETSVSGKRRPHYQRVMHKPNPASTLTRTRSLRLLDNMPHGMLKYILSSME